MWLRGGQGIVDYIRSTSAEILAMLTVIRERNTNTKYTIRGLRFHVKLLVNELRSVYVMVSLRVLPTSDVRPRSSIHDRLALRCSAVYRDMRLYPHTHAHSPGLTRFVPEL